MRLFGLIVAVAAGAALLPSGAAADRVYHSEHLRFAPVEGAPLRSGFVENIKANGPMIYAHEIFVLNGARPSTTYSVTRDFFFGDTECKGDPVPPNEPIATLRTNASGNARGSVVVRPSQITIDGDHGVMWTVRDGDTVVYQTACTVVTLD
jgi:hypothetical protein